MLRRVGVACAVATAIAASIAPGAGAGTFGVVHGGTKNTSSVATTKGASGFSGEQTFEAGPFTVKCESERSTGLAKHESAFLSDSLKFSHCTTTVTAGSNRLTVAAAFTAPLQLLYEAAYPRVGVIAPDSIEIKSLNCAIAIPSQFLSVESNAPGGFEFVNELVPTTKLKDFPSGEQPKLEFYENSEGTATFSGNCASIAPSPLNYRGVRFDEVPSGALYWDRLGYAYEESPVYVLPQLPEEWVHEKSWIGLSSELTSGEWNQETNEVV